MRVTRRGEKEWVVAAEPEFGSDSHFLREQPDADAPQGGRDPAAQERSHMDAVAGAGAFP